MPVLGKVGNKMSSHHILIAPSMQCEYFPKLLALLEVAVVQSVVCWLIRSKSRLPAQAFCESTMGKTQFQLWHNWFKESREDINDNARSGRP